MPETSWNTATTWKVGLVWPSYVYKFVPCRFFCVSVFFGFSQPCCTTQLNFITDSCRTKVFRTCRQYLTDPTISIFTPLPRTGLGLKVDPDRFPWFFDVGNCWLQKNPKFQNGSKAAMKSLQSAWLRMWCNISRLTRSWSLHFFLSIRWLLQVSRPKKSRGS